MPTPNLKRFKIMRGILASGLDAPAAALLAHAVGQDLQAGDIRDIAKQCKRSYSEAHASALVLRSNNLAKYKWQDGSIVFLGPKELEDRFCGEQ